MADYEDTKCARKRTPDDPNTSGLEVTNFAHSPPTNPPHTVYFFVKFACLNFQLEELKEIKKPKNIKLIETK